eukprot:268942-Chlamydomonas_euryale.AAC.1
MDERMPQTRTMAAQETWKQEDYANVKDRSAAALKSEKTLELDELKHERVLIVERSLTTWAMGFDVYGLILEADDIPDPDDKADTAVHHEHGGAKLAVTRLRAVVFMKLRQALKSPYDLSTEPDTCNSAVELLVRVKSVFDTRKSRLQNDAALKFSAVKGNPGEAVAEFLPRFSHAYCLRRSFGDSQSRRTHRQ